MIKVFQRGCAWNEEDYFGLGETADRVELFDGILVVTPCAEPGHQALSLRLALVLDKPARRAGWSAVPAVNVRLGPGRVAIPDLVITRPQSYDALVVDAVDVPFVAEVTWTNAAADRVMKMHYYAVAGIEWYLLVDPKPITLSLFRLDGDHYVLYATAEAGSVLRLTEPIAVDLVPDRLLDR